MAVGGETIGRAYIKILADGNEFEAELGKVIKRAEPTAEKGGEDLAKAKNKGMAKEEDRESKRSLARLRARLGLQAREMTKFGESMGRATGKGARNDFVNMIGTMVGAMPKALGALGQWVSGINKAGSASSEAAKKMQSAGGSVGGLGKAFGIIGQVVQAAAMLKIVTSSIGMLGAAASLTTGLVLALAGSLGFALVGGLVAVAGALVPFAAGIGVAALAMAGLGKKNEGVKQLAKTWEGLQKTAAKAVFGKDGAGLKNLEPILESLEPLIKGVGWALNGLLTDLGKVGQSKGFKGMMTDISAQLPGMVLQIGQIGGKLAVGLGQAFVAAGPIIREFLGFVDDLATKFVAFGKGGPESGLAKFFNDAWASAKIVGGLITDIIDLVGVLFSAGKGTGDQIFADIAKQVQDIVKWLSSPEGQKALKQWFADAKVFGEKLGEIVKSAIELIDALDTEESRAKLMLLLDAINWIIDAITWVITKWGQFKTAAYEAIGGLPAIFSGIIASIQANFAMFIATGLQRWGELVAGIKGFFAPIGAFFVGIWNSIGAGITAFVTTGKQRFSEMGAGLTMAWQAVVTFITSTLPGFVTSVISWFAQIPGRISAVLGDIGGRFQIWLAGVPQKIQSSVGLVVGAFGGLAQKAIARAGNIASGFTKWVAGLPAKARAIVASIASGFTNLAGKAIAKAGSIASRFASWVSSLPGKARSVANSIAAGFGGLASKVIAKAGSLAAKFASWVSSLPGKAKTAANSIANAFSGLAGKVISKAGDLAGKLGAWGRSAVSKAGGVANDIVSKFSGLASRIVNAIGDIVPKIKMPSIKIPTVVAKVVVPKKAAGGITSGPEIAMIGEAGREAIVPLDRALSRVDPAVRALSAFAQGKTMPGQAAAGPSIGRQIDVGGITINTPTTDPRAVASEVVNRMTFAAYI